MTPYQRIAIELRVLTTAKRSPLRLESVVASVQAQRDRYQRNEILAAIDYLANRRLLRLRTPNNTTSKTLFTNVTEKVPLHHHEIVRLLLEIHGVTKSKQ